MSSFSYISEGERSIDRKERILVHVDAVGYFWKTGNTERNVCIMGLNPSRFPYFINVHISIFHSLPRFVGFFVRF
jgi:hypothetical protein